MVEISEYEKDNMMVRLRDADAKFKQGCRQIQTLNNLVHSLKIRYSRAATDKNKSFCCTLRMKLMSLEGVRNLMYEYVCRKCDEIEQLQDIARSELGFVSDDDDEEDMDSIIE